MEQYIVYIPLMTLLASIIGPIIGLYLGNKVDNALSKMTLNNLSQHLEAATKSFQDGIKELHTFSAQCQRERQAVEKDLHSRVCVVESLIERDK